MTNGRGKDEDEVGCCERVGFSMRWTECPDGMQASNIRRVSWSYFLPPKGDARTRVGGQQNSRYWANQATRRVKAGPCCRNGFRAAELTGRAGLAARHNHQDPSSSPKLGPFLCEAYDETTTAAARGSGARARGRPPPTKAASGSLNQAIRSVIRIIATALLTLDDCSFVFLLQVQTKFFLAVNVFPSCST